MTCLLLVTTVKLVIEQQWTMGAGHKARSRLKIPRGQWVCPVAELRSRRQVSRDSLCRLRPGGQQTGDQSGPPSAPEAPAPSRPIWSLCVLLLSGACSGKPWARARSQVSVFKARLDFWEQACTGPSTSILGNITLERQLVSLFSEMSKKSV